MCVGLSFSQLPPRRPASYGAVERLDHDALVPVLERLGERALRFVRSMGDDSRHPVRGRHDALEDRVALLRGQVEDVLAVDVEDVEEERGERHPPRGRSLASAAEAAHRALEPVRRAVLLQRDRLPVEDDRLDR